MLTAHQLEVRAGRAAADGGRELPGRGGGQGRAGRAQRRRQDHADQDPGRRGAAGRRARSTPPATVGYLPQDPRTGDLDVPVRERILSARGLDDVVRRLRAAEADMASDDPERAGQGDAPLRARRRRAARRAAGTPPRRRPRRSPRRSGIADRLMTQPLRTLSGGQRRRVELARILFSGAETLLLDEPTNHLDADSIVWLREFLAVLPRRPDRDQPRHGAARGHGEQGAAPRRQPRRGRHLQHGLEGLPAPARDRRAAPQARAGQHREQGEDAHRPGQQDARQGHQGPGRAVDAQAGREDDGRPRGRAAGRQGRPDQVPGAGAVRQDAAHRGGAVEVLRLAGGLHRRRPGHRQGQPGGHPGAQRRGQDHDAADPGRRRRTRHRRGAARARAQDRLLRPGARDARHQPHGAGEHAVAPPRS